MYPDQCKPQDPTNPDPGPPPDAPAYDPFFDFFPDQVLQADPPTCPVGSGASPFSVAYCQGAGPIDGAQASLLNEMIAAIRSRGGDCVKIANLAQAIADNGHLHFFPATDPNGNLYQFGGGGSFPPTTDPSKAWIVLRDVYGKSDYAAPAFNTAAQSGIQGKTSYPGKYLLASAQWAIVHEVDHLFLNQHLRFDAAGNPDPNGAYEDRYLTKNSLTCSGQH